MDEIDLTDIVEPGAVKVERGYPTPSEVIAAVRIANIRGVSDADISQAFGVSQESIRRWRCDDPAWQAAVTPISRLKSQEKLVAAKIVSQAQTEKAEKREELAGKVALLVAENASQISERNLLLGSKLAEKLLKGAENKVNDGQIEAKDIADIEKIVKIAATVGKWNQPAVTVQQAFTFGTKTADEGIINCESSVIEDSGQYDEQFNLEDGCPV